MRDGVAALAGPELGSGHDAYSLSQRQTSHRHRLPETSIIER
jgi:hypothetical protein